ncbi:MAG TPA: trypsin-like peptidase domain-containing protein [Pirellulaceae bacterium]|jgi:serine protease Do
MRQKPYGSLCKNSPLALLLILYVRTQFSIWGAASAEEPIREYRDTRPTIDLVDTVRVLSADKARELEDEIKAAYKKLASAVVRIWTHDDQGRAFDADGQAVAGGCSGVIIDRHGLILTCSHHGLEPDTAITVGLADGTTVAGKTWGRFRLDDPKPLHFGPDIGLARITESGDWPAATLGDMERPTAGQICLAIGYPGTLHPKRPPLLRAGRILPTYPDWSRVEATTTGLMGDSGGPLFDLQGRVLGVLQTVEGVAGYQSLDPLREYRARLEAGEIVSAAQPASRALRGRNPQTAAFNPALDLEDRVQQVQRSVIRIMDGTHEVAAGLIIDADGWAITKASLVGSREQWSCRVFYTRDGKMVVKGRVIATSAEHDLALLKLDVRDWFVPRWADKRPAVGTFVATVVGRSAGPLQFSIVGAQAGPDLPRSHDTPQLPISIDPAIMEAPTIGGPGWSSAEADYYRELLQPGDVITHLNGIPTPTRDEYGKVMDRLLYAPGREAEPAAGSFAGDWVQVGIRRGKTALTIPMPKIHSIREDGLRWHSHPLSLRRESFLTVFTHDGSLRPEQCGGPVVDLAGNVVGLNIARADATRTLAIPADSLQATIKELIARAREGAK